MRIHFICHSYLPFILLSFCVHCGSSGSACKIKHGKADCSHLKLKEIPSDLPTNITTLDISHNQLRTLPPANLTKYNQLLYLDAGFNTISKLQPELCQNLHLLKGLNLQRNQLHILSDNVFTYCTNLRELNLGFNIIAIRKDSFKSLKNLKSLDVSHNGLSSTKLGSQQQLESLQELVMSQNKITELKKEDFLFLSNSSLQILDLSSNPLTEIYPGCFHAIGKLFGLNLNKVQLGPNRMEKLSLELSSTSIQNLSLSQVQLSRISNLTFNGMQRTNLTILDLSNNYMTVIENGSFVWFKSLQTLNLENNKIASLFSHSLDGLSNINYLNLRNSINKKIDDFAFQSLKHLETLIMDENTFPEITPKTFTGLENLKYLSLSKCAITLGTIKRTITNRTFSSLTDSPLQFLNLTRTKITDIQAGAFSWLGELKTLDLGINEISQDLTGQEFQGLSSIETIYLSYNNLLTLTSDSFAFVPSLRKLRLRRVGCSNLDISPSPFHTLQNLTVLDLGNNNIANVREDLFDRLHQLEILDMQHNNLARLWKHANPGGPVLFLKGLKNLRLLDLESNGIDEIPGNVFHGLSKLRSLNLGSNNLNLFPVSVFNDLASLTSLFLQKNLITAVEEEVFGTVFANLKALDMESNPFDCTCETIAWFVNWLNVSKTYIPGLNQYLCNTPPKYHNTVVAHFDTSPCDNAPFKLFFIVSITVILLLIIVVLLIHFQGWRIKFLWSVSVNRVLGFREIDRPQQQFDYDAYIIHAKKDKNWVYKNFIPLEEQQANNEPIIRFCLEERDFEAGISEFEAIVDSINKSRKTMFIVTNHLLKDPWCKRFKVHHAIQQAIEQSRDSIILIFRHDIPDYKLNSALYLRRAMFKSRCILEWPAQNERVNAFYQQLKSALKSSSRIW
ncbi:toll-like receptor 3 [Heteronotia binoei]|uniref:toll-like receptor 3 n=1 Tax=Heteronotia binoei TaxID=13085 RepID=UPI00292E241B|nr:toll-like receptor 3 [Heteronotia binoei]